MIQRNIVIVAIILLSLVVSFFSGCVDDNQSPNSSFTIYPNILQKNSPFFLNSSSYDPDGFIENYSWFINDMLIGYDSNMTYTLYENGSFSVKLEVIDDNGLKDISEKIIIIGDPEIIKEKFLGLWEWSGNNQTGKWIFYQNNSLKTTFKGLAASVTYWWHFQINGSEICFSEPSNDKLFSGCYIFEFMDSYQTLKVTYDGNTEFWYKSS